ncbi:hypothetical protein HaLaN_29494 [Haematococcus lacustris]|uniref:Uncharacterized protein n=1 Tax=Haematococcus lacustris TaxID=44745 RepID=A0A6A0ACQ9_HAELA|nr:hypothetical protein HaLaN_29494 [Haematococcus lacustris]
MQLSSTDALASRRPSTETATPATYYCANRQVLIAGLNIETDVCYTTHECSTYHEQNLPTNGITRTRGLRSNATPMLVYHALQECSLKKTNKAGWHGCDPSHDDSITQGMLSTMRPLLAAAGRNSRVTRTLVEGPAAKERPNPSSTETVYS